MSENRVRRSPRRLPKPVGLLVVTLVMLGILGGALLGGRAMLASFTSAAAADYDGAGSGQAVVQIRQGDSAGDIGATLVSKHVVQSVAAFRHAADALTRTPGIPEPFHSLLALHASCDYVTVHKSENTTLIAKIEREIEKQEKKLTRQNATRFPKRKVVKGVQRDAQ